MGSTRFHALRRAIILSLAILWCAGCAARSLQPRASSSAPCGNWPAVIAIEQGTMLGVDDMAGISTVGRLLSSTTDRVTISTGKSSVTFLTPDVRRISALKRRSARKARIGVAAGGIAGFVAGGPIFSAMWGGVGACIGAFDGAFEWDGTVVYTRCPV